MNPIEFKLRDGLPFMAIVTLPYPEAKQVPLVLVVHGGPESRDGGRWPRTMVGNRGHA